MYGYDDHEATDNHGTWVKCLDPMVVRTWTTSYKTHFSTYINLKDKFNARLRFSLTNCWPLGQSFRTKGGAYMDKKWKYIIFQKKSLLPYSLTKKPPTKWMISVKRSTKLENFMIAEKVIN